MSGEVAIVPELYGKEVSGCSSAMDGDAAKFDGTEMLLDTKEPTAMIEREETDPPVGIGCSVRMTAPVTTFQLESFY
jgi:hypothetical protein